MDSKQTNNPQLARERVVYDYLESLEHGDIDGLIQSLQQAFYDAPLDQMLVEAHQAYFQEEQRQAQAQQSSLLDLPTRTDLPALRPLSPRQRQKRRAFPVWARVLAAMLLVGLLVGSFAALLKWRQAASNAAPAPTRSTCTVFKPYPASDHGNMSDLLNAVTVAGPRDAWAVGYSVDPHPSIAPLRTLTEYWNGQRWQIIASPNVSAGHGIPENGQLNAVAAVSARDVWAVGSYIGGSVHQQNVDDRILIEHWNGVDWQIVPAPSSPASHIPDSPSGNGRLRAIAAVSANDIWAVGQMMTLDSKHILQVSSLLEHWNGKQWSVVSDFPAPGLTSVYALYGLAVVSAQDIWVAGVTSSNSETQAGIIAHWDGSYWHFFRTSPGVILFYQLSASGPDDIWASGMLAGSGLPQVEHWDGKTWSIVPLPRLAPSTSTVEIFLPAIAAVSVNDVWAAGMLRVDGQEEQFLVLHWNGKSWQRVKVQVPQPGAHNPATAIAIGYNQTWIIGNTEGQKVLIQGCA